MHSTLRASLVGLATLGAACVAAPAAFAGCGGGPAQPASYQAGSDDAQLIPAAFGGGIVGLWSVSLVAGGAQVDWGYSEWHSDGTEIMNSGGHSAASGNFCLGAWRQSGPSTYHLKHFALGYDPSTGNLAVKVTLIEDVTLDRTGDNFSGPFTEDIYPVAGGMIQVTGTITGQRVQPN